MMGRLTVFETGETINKTHQSLTVEGADQRAARFFRRDKLGKRHYFNIRNTPNFFLKIFNRMHLRDIVDLPDCHRRSLHRTHFVSIGKAMYDALRPDRKIFCVADRKSDSFAWKMLGTNVCGFRSITGNHVLCTWTMIRWPRLNV